jgi:hypothetical protein
LIPETAEFPRDVPSRDSGVHIPGSEVESMQYYLTPAICTCLISFCCCLVVVSGDHAFSDLPTIFDKRKNKTPEIVRAFYEDRVHEAGAGFFHKI